MQTSIEEKLNELTIEQKLESIKLVSANKDRVDDALHQLSEIKIEDVDKIGLVLKVNLDGGAYFELDSGGVATVMSSLTKYLKERRTELINQAQELMRSDTK